MCRLDVQRSVILSLVTDVVISSLQPAVAGEVLCLVVCVSVLLMSSLVCRSQQWPVRSSVFMLMFISSVTGKQFALS